jgi:hypothetical protein
LLQTKSSGVLNDAGSCIAASTTPPSLNDFIARVTAMDALCDAELQLQKQQDKTDSKLCNVFRIDSDSDICSEAENVLSEAEDVDWNALFHAHHLQKVFNLSLR